MAKTSMIERELKRSKLVAKYADKRAALKAVLKSQTASDEENGTRRSKCRSCPGMRVLHVSAIVARLQADHTVYTVNLACAEINYVNMP